MNRYIVQRALLMIPTLVGVALITFVLLRLVPGDIVEVRFAGEGAAVSQEVLEAERARLGLNQPIPVQFVNWSLGLLHGDLGESMWTGRPVAQEIAIRLELSLQLAIMATLIGTFLAIPLGIIAAVKQDTWIDQAIRVFSVAGLSLPSFWLGVVMILALLYSFQWIPPVTFVSFLDDPIANLTQLIWPALAVGYRFSAVATRMTRSGTVEVMREDYIRTARAKGLVETLVVRRHALRNALLPAVTVIGLEFAFILGGLVVTEQVFNLNGIGKLLVDAVSYRDYTMIQGIVMLLASFTVFINLLVDLAYGWLDPRVRYA